MSASRAFARPMVLVAALVVLAPLCVLLIRSAPHASGPIIVNTLGDPGPAGTCDLRDAITNANGMDKSGSTNCAAGTGTDTINFSVSGTITLGGGLPAIVNNLTIDGTGQSVTVDGAGSYQVLLVNRVGATLNLNNLTIANGNSAGFGAGISSNGTLTVTNSTFSGNSAFSGGAIYNGYTLTVTNSTFSGNSATYGGGIYFGYTATVTNSTFSGNNAAAAAASLKRRARSRYATPFWPTAWGETAGILAALFSTAATIFPMTARVLLGAEQAPICSP